MPRKADARISVKFLNVDVTGNAASAKFEFYVGSKLTFIDYMSLYKYDGTWKIVSKIYYRFP
jgi:protease I